ncbi:MAG: hypothetical protein Q8R36_03845 [bacterium]|nr:hypothetical protein [bacterium]
MKTGMDAKYALLISALSWMLSSIFGGGILWNAIGTISLVFGIVEIFRERKNKQKQN